ncbi:hypothetical protein AAFF_G00363620 [Aldrovandia affinis]|uniref:Uncharacterized protein n=1 Tax=Aldrovandia affinis TaxID=143900 RepID=A0AAD7WN05_9TELE|nr:hypothetical protein AAFF_G00363620 [Aldrovandia affinis]
MRPLGNVHKAKGSISSDMRLKASAWAVSLLRGEGLPPALHAARRAFLWLRAQRQLLRGKAICPRQLRVSLSVGTICLPTESRPHRGFLPCSGGDTLGSPASMAWHGGLLSPGPFSGLCGPFPVR